MKYFIVFLISLFLWGCASQKTSNYLSDLKKEIYYNLNECKEGYTCSLKIIPNKSIVLLKDDFNNYYSKTINSDRILIKYVLKRASIKGLADVEHQETLYFSIRGSDNNVTLKNEELSKIDLVLDRQCYCKGSAGYFKITKGYFRFAIKKNELTLSTDFTIPNIPHVLHKIDEKMILEQ